MADMKASNGNASVKQHFHLANVAHQIMHSRVRHGFHCHASDSQTARLEQVREDNGDLGLALTRIWIGLAVKHREDHSIEIGFACHDGTYTMDFAVHVLYARNESRERPVATPDTQAQGVAEYLMDIIREYSRRNLYKILGAGLSSELVALSPQLPSLLWAELDILSMNLVRDGHFDEVDEVADSMARKCVMWFGPNGLPRLQVGHFNDVEVDLNGRAQFTILKQYEEDVAPRTARAAAKFAHSLKTGQKNIAFFSATPQGGGVALMRHALLRYLGLAGVNCTWYVTHLQRSGTSPD
jgi:hypothetical protein